MHTADNHDLGAEMKPVDTCLRRLLPSGACWLALSLPAAAAEADPAAIVDAYAPRLAQVAGTIWDKAELGFQETQSSELLQQELRSAGFTLQHNVAGMPTAFIARAGKGGGPVIAILAEMDALPGVSQAAVPRRQPIPAKDAGHACGHNLFGAASIAAARAVKQWMEASGQPGEVRVYGAPAEEGGSGKVYLVKAGLFDDVDVVLHWHPGDRNSAAQNTALANVSGKFRFAGIASHAAAAPERGRSALDGVEALNAMANMMREHVPQDTRIHYVITDGGKAPNVVPATSTVYYYVRHQDPEVAKSVMARLKKAAEGAALGTETRMEYEPVGGTYNLLPNDVLGRVMDTNLRRVGGLRYTASDRAFAMELHTSLATAPAISQAAEIAAYEVDKVMHGSTDVGDVSWVVPTVGLSTATWVPGTAAHSWQAVAAGGNAIGYQGATIAAKVLALTIVSAKAEFDQRRGPEFTYVSLLERDTPALDYRRLGSND
jgi:aminobenzoyl-glutamate utilization protein B